VSIIHKRIQHSSEDKKWQGRYIKSMPNNAYPAIFIILKLSFTDTLKATFIGHVPSTFKHIKKLFYKCVVDVNILAAHMVYKIYIFSLII